MIHSGQLVGLSHMDMVLKVKMMMIVGISFLMASSFLMLLVGALDSELNCSWFCRWEEYGTMAVDYGEAINRFLRPHFR
ncbi:unnamed protein product [Arabis nemorensis]|uniref:Uncharacterized protein n=1 Tax=Arabis nemorensis TaxID=586526 RepID=A0A565AQD6_9BRAS|nr:unnamed protein product [Arabis nemorensis]